MDQLCQSTIRIFDVPLFNQLERFTKVVGKAFDLADVPELEHG